MATSSVPAGVNLNRRITFRRMGQMNGDFLTNLKNPPRAEASRPLLGQLEAHKAGMKKQLDLWHKEQNIALNKINRGQAKVYKTFLKVHYDQRRLERLAAEKRRQKELLEAAQARIEQLGAGLQSAESTRDAPKPILDADIKREPVHKSEQTGDQTKTSEVPEDESTKISKKYNRHRSEFQVVVNAPAAIEVEKEKEKPKDTDNIDGKVKADGKEHPVDKVDGHILTEKQPSDIRPARQAKVLVVRKQALEGGGNKENTLISDHGGSFIRQGSKSFIQERSGSFFIQTVTMANENIAKDMVGNEDDGKGASVTSHITPLKPSPALKVNQNDVSLSLKAISESNKKVSGESTESSIRPKSSKLSPRKATSYKLGELKIRTGRKKPPPPTSYTMSIIDKEKQRERLALQNGMSSRLTKSESLYGSESPADDDSNTDSKITSLVAYNKRKRRLRERQRREILDRETPIIYEKNEQWEIVRSGYDFKRREFKRPSSREKKMRKKLLEQSREMMKQEREKVVQYIDKLSEEGMYLKGNFSSSNLHC